MIIGIKEKMSRNQIKERKRIVITLVFTDFQNECFYSIVFLNKGNGEELYVINILHKWYKY